MIQLELIDFPVIALKSVDDVFDDTKGPSRLLKPLRVLPSRRPSCPTARHSTPERFSRTLGH